MARVTLRIEELGPLRRTEATFGDVTVIIGWPNTGKSYLLRALYEALAPGDSRGLASCITSRLGDAPSAGGLVKVEAWRRGEEYGARICVQLKGLAETLEKKMRECHRAGLLPPHRVEVHGVKRSVGLDEAARRAALELLGELGEDLQREGARVSLLSPSAETAVCLEAEGLRPKARGLGRWLSLARGGNELEGIRFGLRLRLPPWRLVERTLAHAAPARVVYAAYGRSVAAQILLYSSMPVPDLGRAIEQDVLREALGERSLPFLSLYEAIAGGYLELHRGTEAAKKALEVFKPLLMGRVEAVPGDLVYSWDGASISIKYASALAGEASALMLAVAGLLSQNSGERWLLIEEPEAQLHPALQAIAAAVLLKLAAEENIKVALTTHSDILATVMLDLAAAARERRLGKALRELRELLGIDVPTLDEERLRSIDVHVLYTEEAGAHAYRVRQLSIEEALAELPGLSDTLLNIARWGLGQLITR